MRVALDTNVLVSALLRPAGPPARILDLILGRQVTLALDNRIFDEYRNVLALPEFRLTETHVALILNLIWGSSERVQPEPLPLRLPDPYDTMFIEVAVSALADAFITGNLKDFPPGQRYGVRVLSPREWLNFWAKLGGE